MKKTAIDTKQEPLVNVVSFMTLKLHNMEHKCRLDSPKIEKNINDKNKYQVQTSVNKITIQIYN